MNNFLLPVLFPFRREAGAESFPEFYLKREHVVLYFPCNRNLSAAAYKAAADLSEAGVRNRSDQDLSITRLQRADAEDRGVVEFSYAAKSIVVKETILFPF